MTEPDRPTIDTLYAVVPDQADEWLDSVTETLVEGGPLPWPWVDLRVVSDNSERAIFRGLLGRIEIAPGESRSIKVIPSVPFYELVIQIPTRVAYVIFVDDVRIGEECLLDNGQRPGFIFAEDADPMLVILMPKFVKGETLVVTLRNVGHSAISELIHAKAWVKK